MSDSQISSTILDLLSGSIDKANIEETLLKLNSTTDFGSLEVSMYISYGSSSQISAFTSRVIEVIQSFIDNSELTAASKVSENFIEFLTKYNLLTPEISIEIKLLIGEVAKCEGKLEILKKCYQEALALAKENSSCRVKIPEIYLRVCTLYLENDNTEKAIKKAKKSVSLAEHLLNIETNNKNKIVQYLVDGASILCVIFLHQNITDQAEEWYNYIKKLQEKYEINEANCQYLAFIKSQFDEELATRTTEEKSSVRSKKKQAKKDALKTVRLPGLKPTNLNKTEILIKNSPEKLIRDNFVPQENPFIRKNLKLDKQQKNLLMPIDNGVAIKPKNEGNPALKYLNDPKINHARRNSIETISPLPHSKEETLKSARPSHSIMTQFEKAKEEGNKTEIYSKEEAKAIEKPEEILSGTLKIEKLLNNQEFDTNENHPAVVSSKNETQSKNNIDTSPEVSNKNEKITDLPNGQEVLKARRLIHKISIQTNHEVTKEVPQNSPQSSLHTDNSGFIDKKPQKGKNSPKSSKQKSEPQSPWKIRKNSRKKTLASTPKPRDETPSFQQSKKSTKKFSNPPRSVSPTKDPLIPKEATIHNLISNGQSPLERESTGISERKVGISNIARPQNTTPMKSKATYQMNIAEIRTADTSEVLQESKVHHQKTEENVKPRNSSPRCGDITKALLVIQSAIRRYKEYKRYKGRKIQNQLLKEYIAFGKKEIDGVLHFVTVTQDGFHQKALKQLGGLQGGKFTKSNVIVDAFPLVSGIAKPKCSCYSENEICELLSVWKLDELVGIYQIMLIELVTIKYGFVVLKAAQEREEARRRLLYRGRSKLRSNSYYFIKIYELDYGGKEEILIVAVNPQETKSLKIKPDELIEILKVKKREMLQERLPQVLELLYLNQGQLCIASEN
ncbi:unnamed protein product [Blepharisma stoltei]|uniref:Uncharacterized protein n=1 Tax=Blepharisma stoltei TaxID=1481888 RepID=A0AAU9K745_9CILI|nr:unnamed protein product [Blepharisma stoltei]